MSPSYQAEHIILRYIEASTMQKLKTHHSRLSTANPSLIMITLVRNSNASLILLIRLDFLHIGLIHLFVANSVSHPVATSGIEEQVDQCNSECGHILEWIAGLRVRMERKRYAAVVGKQS